MGIPKRAAWHRFPLGHPKTRTVIALADLLLRCNWAKRIR
jgi:hypothetical protein